MREVETFNNTLDYSQHATDVLDGQYWHREAKANTASQKHPYLSKNVPRGIDLALDLVAASFVSHKDVICLGLQGRSARHHGQQNGQRQDRNGFVHFRCRGFFVTIVVF